MEDADDAALLARMAEGDERQVREALRLLYERHAPAVQAHAERVLRPGTCDPGDIVQETFLAALANAAGFRSGSALPWLLTIASSRAIDAMRHSERRLQRERERPAVREPVETPSGPPSELESKLRALPPNWRSAVCLRFTENLSYAQVATILGVSLRTAKEWTKRGLERLRELMPEQ